jgi:small basic protein
VVLLPFVAFVVGLLLARFFPWNAVGGLTGQYLAVACLAGIDTVFGGIRSVLESKFNGIVFITGFVSNTLIAFFLAWLGDRIGIDLYVAVALVLGARIFTNLSLIRRFIITRLQDNADRKKLQSIVQATAGAPEPNI